LVSSLSVTPAASVAAGDRLVVETGTWNSSGATIKSVTDSAGDQFTELLHYKASDATEMSVWSAPITAGSGTRPQITVTPTSKADVGAAALEYSGASSVADATVVDQMAHASGTTKAAATVASGATPATTGAGELALGFYADSGFGDSLSPGSGYTARVNVSNTPDMELLAEDQPLAAAGATPNASAGTGASTIWLMATLVLKGAPVGSAATTAAAMQARASAKTLSSDRASRHMTRAHQHKRHRRALLSCPKRGAKSAGCRSLRRARALTAAASARFIYLALLEHLPSNLFCYHGRGAGAPPAWTAAWLRGGS
jgi:hypothetical protein